MQKKSVLDDLEMIKRIDKASMLSSCVKSCEHYAEAVEIASQLNVRFPMPENVIVAGLGGSGIGGELLKDWARSKAAMPIEVIRDYSLPAYANKDSLVVVVSYSGETEETLSVFHDALKRKCMIICISSGGVLLDVAGKIGIPHLRVPSGFAPRAALPYLFVPLPIILEKIGAVSGFTAEIGEAVAVLKRVASENAPDKTLEENFCKTLASNIMGTIPVIYGFSFFKSVAQRFKTQFNENSKNVSKYEYFSELDHNEIVGWQESRKPAKSFSIIQIRDKNESPEICRRIEVTEELMRKNSHLKIYEVWSKGKNTLAKMASTILIGDFVSSYLAILRGIDPTPVKTISILKQQVEQTGVKKRIVQDLHRFSSR